MRILLLTQYFWPETGAAQVRLQELAQGLQKFGHEVTVVTAFPNHPTGIIPPEYRGKLFQRESWQGMTIIRTWVYPVQRGRFWLRLWNYFSFVLSAMWGVVRSGPQDLIVVESPPLFIGFTALFAKLVKRAPYIFNISDLWPESAVVLGLVTNRKVIRLAEGLERYFYRKAAMLSTQTEGIIASLVQRGIPQEKIMFLPNGVDPELFRPRPPDKLLAKQLGLEGKYIVLYAGTMGYAHGIETALNAAEILREHPEIYFLFVGDGSERPKLEQLARDKGLTNVKFIDFQPLEQISRYYSLSSLNLSTLRRYSLSEGVRPSKVFPGLASGKPLVYVGEGEGAKVVEASGGGVVLEPENPELLAQTILRLKEEPEVCSTMAAKGREYVTENYAWPKLIEKWLEDLPKGVKI